MSRSCVSGPVRLLVAIPCFNEQETIGAVLKSVPALIEGVSQVDVLVVDDGSADGTRRIAQDCGAKVVAHPKNLGVGRAFQTAVGYAVENGYDLMVNIDGDGQFDPGDIPLLVEPILQHKADMVTASRFLNPEFIPAMPPVKRVGNHMMSYLVSSLIRKQYHDVSCGFRCYNREALLQLNLHGDFTYTQESFLDFAAKRLSIVEVPVRVRYFAGRTSRVAGSLPRYALNTAKIIFRSYRDYFPLRFFWGIALVFAIPACVFGAIFFAHYLATGLFSGYLFAAFLSAFFSVMATVFFVVGIVADMLDRVRKNQDRIIYALKKLDNARKDGADG